jgi:hypothetical protein
LTTVEVKPGVFLLIDRLKFKAIVALNIKPAIMNLSTENLSSG